MRSRRGCGSSSLRWKAALQLFQGLLLMRLFALASIALDAVVALRILFPALGTLPDQN